MKVLFVSSGNLGGIHHGTNAQAESISNGGIDVDVFLVTGKGIYGYLKNLSPLRKKVEANNYDLIHAIGGHCGLLCSIGLHGKRKVVSYLGSDIQKIREQKPGIIDEFFRKLILLSSHSFS